MATARYHISTVRSSHKLLGTDSIITDRAILAELRVSTILLVKRETDKRKLWATDTLFQSLPCLEMKEVSISECCEFVDDCTISRSKFKLPRMSEGNYQYLIQGAWSINAMGGKGQKFKEITINRYINLLKLPVIKKQMYYWIVDNYLYTNNPNLQALRLAAFFEEDIPNEIMYPDCNCGVEPTLDDLCKNPLDKEFPLPGYLSEQVLQMVSQKLLQRYFNIKTDMTQEGIDGQAPNTKPTN